MYIRESMQSFANVLPRSQPRAYLRIEWVIILNVLSQA